MFHQTEVAHKEQVSSIMRFNPYVIKLYDILLILHKILSEKGVQHSPMRTQITQKIILRQKMNIIETNPTKKMKANYNEVLQTKNK